MGVFCKNHSAGTEAQNIGNDDNIAWAYRIAFILFELYDNKYYIKLLVEFKMILRNFDVIKWYLKT